MLGAAKGPSTTVSAGRPRWLCGGRKPRKSGREVMGRLPRGTGRALPCHYLSLTEGHHLVGVHSQPHLGQVLPHGFGVVPGMSDVGATERESAALSSRRPFWPRPAASSTRGPSPLDPRGCLPSSIPVQTLPVNIVTELLPPGLPLGLGHHADHLSVNSDSEPLTPRTSCSRLLPVAVRTAWQAFWEM